MARAWIELPADSGWGDVRVAGTRLAGLDYLTYELRGSGNVMLRLPGVPLERSEVLRVPDG